MDLSFQRNQMYGMIVTRKKKDVISMFDFHFDWNPGLETGIEEIDEQHKEFCRIGRDIEQLLQYRCIGVTEKQMLGIVCELREYVAYHSYDEEQLMEQVGYAKLEEHRKAHRKFTEYVESIDCPAMKREPEKELRKVKDALQDMMFEHVMKMDMEAAKEIKQLLDAKKTTILE